MLGVKKMAAPMAAKVVEALSTGLEVLWTCCIFQLLITVACDEYGDFGGFLLCRKCGYEIARAEDVISVPSSLAIRQRNDTFVHKNSSSSRVLIQLFKNQQGMYFEVLTCLEAEVERSAEKYVTDSWFPGYSWSIANCPRCGTHLGWFFQAVSDSGLFSFVGFIFDKIMHEDEVNNLIAMPKTYAS